MNADTAIEQIHQQQVLDALRIRDEFAGENRVLSVFPRPERHAANWRQERIDYVRWLNASIRECLPSEPQRGKYARFPGSALKQDAHHRVWGW